MPDAKRIEEAAGELTKAMQMMECLLSMLGQMPVGASVEASGLARLLVPAIGKIGFALNHIS